MPAAATDKRRNNEHRNSPCFAGVFPVIEKLIRQETDNLADYLARQLQTLAAFMGIDTEFVAIRDRCENDHLSGQARVLDICKRGGATTYINPQGGQALYDTETFRSAGIDLRFIGMLALPYQQRAAGFVPYLSIIDALMELGPVDLKHHVDAFDLITCRKDAPEPILPSESQR